MTSLQRLHVLMITALLLTGCSGMLIVIPGLSDDPQERVATLADLNPAVMPDKNAALPQVDLDTLVATYRDVLSVTEDADIRLRVQHRLAGLEMKRGEQVLYQQETAGNAFQLAIEAYTALLVENSNHSRNDLLLYQLSKAYDLGGQLDQSMRVLDQLISDFPQSSHYAEAQFRRAEIFFSRSDYRNAELAYAEVINQGENTSYYQNALYMHGWSQFKQERYRASLQSFDQVLATNVPVDNQLESLSRGQRELTQDTFKVMSIVFSYLDGAQTIVEVYQHFGERHYLPLLYDNLGKLYLQQERYRDSAESYRAFVDLYPQSDQSPVFYASLIDTYIAGGFAADVLLEKENYINIYGINSQYWAQKSEFSRNYIRPFVEKYLPELARHYHAKAQAISTRLADPVTAIKSADKKTSNNASDKNFSKKEQAQQQQLAVSDYLKAGNYYQEFIDTFPENDQVPEMHFLLAESRFEAGVYDEAIEAYEIVAYKYPDHQRGAKAGYAAIIAYGLLIDQFKQQEQQTDPQTASTDMLTSEKWLRLKIASQLRFAGTFQHDPNAATVLVKAAEELLALQEYPHALEAATQLIRKQPPAEKSLRKTAWLVIGHSEFELQNYASAETAYQQTLAILEPNDRSHATITDRLAASVYKQAELALVAGDAMSAADQFLRVYQVAPDSDISVTARFDAANTLMAASSWALSINVLNQFRQDYPDHPLTADIPAKMVVAYREHGQWALAADELTDIYQRSSDEAVKRESLYQAAELYEKAGDVQSAILRYRRYANNYPEPYGTAMEARYSLSELYRQTKQYDKRRFWLKKMIAADSNAGAQRNQRSIYLAAFSSSVFADDDYQTFKKIKLSLPLKNSLKKKKRALKKVLASYQAVADYAVAEFATMATYRIASIYSQLSGDLIASERPNNLDELALEQYEILLEEQAYPFEEKAITIYETNTRRSWDGVYDDWVQKSFAALKLLLPARYGKEELGGGYNNEIY